MKNFKTLIALALISGGAFAETPDIRNLVGTYEGISGSPEWMKDPRPCQVTISISRRKEVEVTLTVEGGIPLYTRQSGSRSYKETRLSELRFPKVSVRELKKAEYETGYMMTKGNYGLGILNLDTAYGMIQVNYTKSDPMSVYNAVLAYTDSLTGCYDVRKIQ